MDTAADNSAPEYNLVPLRGIAISGAEAGSDDSYVYQGMPTEIQIPKW